MIVPSASVLISLLEHYIYVWGIFIVPVGAFLENSVILGFIFPGTTIIFLSGFVARTTGSDLWTVVVLAAIGSFLGDNFDYFIGRKVGKVLERKPLFSKPIRMVEPFLKKHGAWAIFIGRFSAWSRAWVALASGMVGFRYIIFAIASALSAAVWTSVWVIGGYLLGGNKDLIEEWLTKGSIVAWIAILALVIYYFRVRLKLAIDLIGFWGNKYGKKVKASFRKEDAV